MKGTKQQIQRAEQIKGRMLNTLLYHTPHTNYLQHKVNTTILRNPNGTWYSLNLLIKKRAMRIDMPKEKILFQLFVNIINAQTKAEWFLERAHFQSGGHLIAIIASKMTAREIENFLMVIFPK